MKKLLTFFSVLAITFTLLTPTVKAATNYNNIISDPIFDNASSMNASQIDSFLNSFPNSCISTNNGFSASDAAGYNPTDGYKYGDLVSAGTIIYHAAQAFGINPQVLLTTLQKEQGLVVGDGGNVIRSGPDNKNCGALAISASVGYNCPDSMHLSDYSGFILYAYRGTPITSVSQTCVEHAAYVGFTRQVVIAAWQFTFDRHRSEGQNNWYANKPNWDNSDDLSFCYSQRTVAGGPFYLCPDKVGHSSDPLISHSGQYPIDDIVVTIANGATAAFYNYTPHKHGQDLFTNFFVSWFGSPYTNCIYPAPSANAVYRLYSKGTANQFLTADPGEVCAATSIGYLYDGQLFNSESSQGQAVYRLRNGARYLYTASAGERDDAINKYGFQLEGVAFNGVNPSMNPSEARAVYRLVSNIGTYVYTISTYEKDSYINIGYTYEGVAFYLKEVPGAAVVPTYRLANPSGAFLLTQSTGERDYAVQSFGYQYQGAAFNTINRLNTVTVPIYRLAGPGGYLFTTSLKERAQAGNYGYRDEGITMFTYGSMSDPSLNRAYRLARSGSYLYTTSAAERDSAVQNYGYHLEGIGFLVP
jgi:hypothetical protein